MNALSIMANIGEWLGFLSWIFALILGSVAAWLILKSRTENQLHTQEAVNNTETDSESSFPAPEAPTKGKLIGGIFSGLLAAIFFIAGFFIMSNSNSNEVIVETENQNNDVVANTEDDEVYYLGILPLRNPSAMLERFSGVEKYLQETTGLNIKLKLYPTSGSVGGYTAVVKDIASGKIQFAFLASVTVVQANANGPVIPFACAQKSGSPVYHGHIAVRNDSPYQTVDDLKGKAVCGSSASSTSGNLMPSAMLLKRGIDKNTYFEPFEFLGSHDKAAEAVLAGTMQGSFINEATFEKYNEKYKDQELGLKSVWKHDAVPEFPFCVNTEEVSPEVLQKVKDALLSMHETNIDGVKAVEKKYDKWVEINWDSYLDIKKAVEEVHGEGFYDLEAWTGK